MLTHIIFDFSWVLLFPRDADYRGALNTLHQELSREPDYRVLDHFRLNEELLNLLATSHSNFQLVVYTAGRMHTLPEVKKRLDSLFSHYFTEQELGPKSAPASFHRLAKKLAAEPSTLLFIDDKPVNVQAAQQAGLHGLKFLANNRLFSSLAQYVP